MDTKVFECPAGLLLSLLASLLNVVAEELDALRNEWIIDLSRARTSERQSDQERTKEPLLVSALTYGLTKLGPGLPSTATCPGIPWCSVATVTPLAFISAGLW